MSLRLGAPRGAAQTLKSAAQTLQGAAQTLPIAAQTLQGAAKFPGRVRSKITGMQTQLRNR